MIRNNRDEVIYQEQLNSRFLVVKKSYTDICGDLHSAAVLGKIVYWHMPSSSGKSRLRIFKEGHLWLAMRREDWEEDCCVKPKQFDKARKKLEAMNLIICKRFKFNAVPTVHIRLDWDGYAAVLKEWSDDQQLKRDASGYSQNGKNHIPKSEEKVIPSSQIGKNHIPDLGRSITKSTNNETITTTIKKKVFDKRSDYLFHPKLDFVLDAPLKRAWIKLIDDEGQMTLQQAKFMSMHYHTAITNTHNEFRGFNLESHSKTSKNYVTFLKSFEYNFRVAYLEYAKLYHDVVNQLLVEQDEFFDFEDNFNAQEALAHFKKCALKQDENIDNNFPYYPMKSLIDFIESFDYFHAKYEGSIEYFNKKLSSYIINTDIVPELHINESCQLITPE